MLHAADRIAGLEARVQELEAAQRRKAASETLSDTGQVVAFGDQIKLQVTDDDELFAVKNVLVTRYKSVGDLRRAVLSTQSDTAPPPPEVEQ
jgi:transcription elongation GreA/GreB family factor